MNTYKATNINYDTDGQPVPGLPKTLTVKAENMESVADAISDKTGWCVESIGKIERVIKKNRKKIPTYDELVKKFDAIEKETEKALLKLLNSRDIESINVMAYTDAEITDECCFSQTDKNGYGINIRLKTLRKNEKNKWVSDVLDEDLDDWGTLDIDRFDYSCADLLFILRMVEAIFHYADEKDNGRILSADEEFEEE